MISICTWMPLGILGLLTLSCQTIGQCTSPLYLCSCSCLSLCTSNRSNQSKVCASTDMRLGAGTIITFYNIKPQHPNVCHLHVELACRACRGYPLAQFMYKLVMCVLLSQIVSRISKTGFHKPSQTIPQCLRMSPGSVCLFFISLGPQRSQKSQCIIPQGIIPYLF